MALDLGAITQGVDVFSAGLEGLVSDDATVDSQAGLLGQGDARAQADGGQHHIGFNARAVGQLGDQLVVVAVIHRLGQGAKVEGHAQIRQATTHGGRGRFRQQQRQTTALGFHQGHRIATVGQVIGKLTANQTPTEDGDFLGALQGSAEFAVIHQVIDGEHVAHGIAFQRRRPGIRAQGQHQLAVVQVVVRQQHALAGRIDLCHVHIGAHFHIELLGNLLRRGHAQVISGFFLGKTGGQHGLGIVTAVVTGEHDDGRVLVQLAEFLDGVEAGKAGTDDDDRLHEQSLINQ